MKRTVMDTDTKNRVAQSAPSACISAEHDASPAARQAPAMTRREFMRYSAAAATAAVGGVPLDAMSANVITELEAAKLHWSKAPCRFCGVGCGVSVAVKDGQVVATHGDMQAEV